MGPLCWNSGIQLVFTRETQQPPLLFPVHCIASSYLLLNSFSKLTCKYLWAKKQVLLHFFLLFQSRWKDVGVHVWEKKLLCKTGFSGVSHISSMNGMFLLERTILLIPINPWEACTLGILVCFYRYYSDDMIKTLPWNDRLSSLWESQRFLTSVNGVMTFFGLRYNHYIRAHLLRPIPEPVMWLGKQPI